LAHTGTHLIHTSVIVPNLIFLISISRTHAQKWEAAITEFIYFEHSGPNSSCQYIQDVAVKYSM